MNEIESIKRKNAALKVEIEKKTADIEAISNEKARLDKSHQTLKLISKQLEDQLKTYSEKFSQVSTAKKSLIQQKSYICDEIDTLKHKLETTIEKLIQVTKEKEELANEFDIKSIDFKNKLSEQTIDYNKLSREYNIETEKCHQLEEKIKWFEENLNDCNVEIKRLNKELILIKEEAANHITVITSLRNEREELVEELNNKLLFENALLEKIETLKNEFDEKESEMIRDRITINETLAQHKKLIEFISSKNLGSKKKDLFKLI